MSITLKELNSKIAKADKVRISEGFVNNKTRQGLYLVLRTGMTHDLIFVGRDVENDKNIIEAL